MITKKEIFKCMLAGEPVHLDMGSLKTKKDLQVLLDAGLWEWDNLHSQKFWSEYSFKILYPIRLIDIDGKLLFLTKGDHHLVCL